MIDVAEALAVHLTLDAGVQAVVQGSVYPVRLPQGSSLPAITYQQISGPVDYTLAREVANVRARMQVSCWGNSYADAKRAARAVKASLPLLRTVNSLDGALQITRVTLAGETDLFEPEAQDFHVALDVAIWHRA